MRCCEADSFRDRSRSLVAMCAHILTGSNSMSRCSDWLKNEDVREGSDLDSGPSQRTIDRAISLIGNHGEEIIVKLWEGLDARYHFDNTDANTDGFAVVVNGSEAELDAVGYPRDLKDQSGKQVGLLTAELQKSKMTFFVRAYKGNTPPSGEGRGSAVRKKIERRSPRRLQPRRRSPPMRAWSTDRPLLRSGSASCGSPRRLRDSVFQPPARRFSLYLFR